MKGIIMIVVGVAITMYNHSSGNSKLVFKGTHFDFGYVVIGLGVLSLLSSLFSSNTATTTQASPDGPQNTKESKSVATIEDQLVSLKAEFDQKHISEQDYMATKKQILDAHYVPAGKWKCNCGRINEELFSFCQGCQAERA